MQMPNQKTVVVDPEQNVQYEVIAYRILSEVEAVRAIRAFLMNTPKKKRPKPNSRIQIGTTIGSF